MSSTNTFSGGRRPRRGQSRAVDLFRSVALLAAGVVLAGCELLPMAVGAQPYPGEKWSSSPLPPDPVLAEAALALCGADFGIDADDLRIAVQAQYSSHRAAFILSAPDGVVDCIVAHPSPNGEPVVGGGGSFGSVGGFPDQEDLFLAGESAGPPASRAYGRAAPGIEEVRVQTTNSGAIEASMGGGWFLAMWPGVGQVVSVEGLDASGAVIASVPGFGDVWDLDPPLEATPYPTLRLSVPSAMAAAIEAAEPFATELSRTPAVLDTAFSLALDDYCANGMCPGITGPGWGVVFEITGPDGKLGKVLVILDSDRNLVLTEQ